jgi:hypothetical protein
MVQGGGMKDEAHTLPIPELDDIATSRKRGNGLSL